MNKVNPAKFSVGDPVIVQNFERDYPFIVEAISVDEKAEGLGEKNPWGSFYVYELSGIRDVKYRECSLRVATKEELELGREKLHLELSERFELMKSEWDVVKEKISLFNAFNDCKDVGNA